MAPLPFVTQLVALSFRVGYHDALTGVPLNVARHVDRAAAAALDADAYKPPEPGAVENPLRGRNPFEDTSEDEDDVSASEPGTELVAQEEPPA